MQSYNIQSYVKIAFLGLLTTVITSCSYIYGEEGLIRNHDTKYLKAKSIPPLNIPSGLSSSTLQAHYPISNGYPTAQEKVDLTPPELNNPGNKTQ